MTNQTTRTSIKNAVLGTVLATAALGAAPAGAQLTAATCQSGAYRLYMAQRTVTALDYRRCRSACLETLATARQCIRDCMDDRGAAQDAYRTDLDTHRAACGGGTDAAALRAVPSTCGPDLSDCSADVRSSAVACHRLVRDVNAFATCVASVSAAADKCAAEFDACMTPDAAPNP